MTSTTELPVISLNTVLETTNEVVAEFGREYVYDRAMIAGDTCVYVYAGSPSCLVGHVLHRLGVPVSALSVADGIGMSLASEEVERTLGVYVDDLALTFLNAAQAAQDEMFPWGVAVEHGMEAIEDVEE